MKLVTVQNHSPGLTIMVIKTRSDLHAFTETKLGY